MYVLCGSSSVSSQVNRPVFLVFGWLFFCHIKKFYKYIFYKYIFYSLKTVKGAVILKAPRNSDSFDKTNMKSTCLHTKIHIHRRKQSRAYLVLERWTHELFISYDLSLIILICSLKQIKQKFESSLCTWLFNHRFVFICLFLSLALLRRFLPTVSRFSPDDSPGHLAS